MSDIASFPPIASPDARLLILGSIPGKASLDARQYYAHPRNQFWPIMASLLGFPPDDTYVDKTRHLIRAHIALWDVVAACHRSGSLDADIDKTSVRVNDFANFLRLHRDITRIYFNGATAEQTFRRRVLPTLDIDDSMTLHRLPSTSPAYAGLRFQQKLAAWSVVLENH